MSPESQHADPPDQVRNAQEIARRALVLCTIVGLAAGAPKDEVLGWLEDESLKDELTPSELAFATSPYPTKQQQMNASWRSEALLVLLWALNAIEQMPALNEQCSTRDFQQILPPFADISVEQFINGAMRRSDEELIDCADALLACHWEARNARLHGRPVPAHCDLDIIQERHHAINWVIGYDGLPWDEVTTDT